MSSFCLKKVRLFFGVLETAFLWVFMGVNALVPEDVVFFLSRFKVWMTNKCLITWVRLRKWWSWVRSGGRASVVLN